MAGQKTPAWLKCGRWVAGSGIVLAILLGIGHVALVEFERPPHNHITVGLARELADAFEAIDADGELRCSVLASGGDHRKRIGSDLCSRARRWLLRRPGARRCALALRTVARTPRANRDMSPSIQSRLSRGLRARCATGESGTWCSRPPRKM